MEASRKFLWYEQILLFVGAGLAIFMRVGFSPLLWLDTLNDLRLVNLCLDHGHCLLNGAPVSFGHFLQGAAWHQMLSLFSWLGLSVSGTHLVMLVFDALALVLVAVATARIAGRVAGLLAMLTCLLLVDSMDPLGQMVWNFRPLLFLGASILGMCIWLADKQKLSMAACAAALAAIAANIHMVSAALFPSLLIICLCLEEKRLKLAATAAGVFLVVLVAGSPAAWWHNLKVLFSGSWFPSGITGPDSTMLGWAVIAGAAACAGLAFIIRRKILVLVALILPLLLLFLAARMFTSMNRTDRYLAPVIPAVAAGIGVLFGRLAALIQERVRLGARPRELLHKATPLIAAVLLCLLPGQQPRWAGFPIPDFSEADKVLGFVHNKQGWDSDMVFQGLKGPFDYLMLEYSKVSRAWKERSGAAPEIAPGAIAIPIAPDQLPRETPRNFILISKTSERVMLVVLESRWLDWSSFRVCTTDEPDRAPKSCPLTRLSSKSASLLRPDFAVRHMPDAGRRLGQDLVLRVAARLPAGNEIHELWMPRTNDLCGGLIISVPGEASQVSLDGRHARLVADPIGEQTGEVVLAWKIGSPDCPFNTYSGFVPFFLEADASSMRLLRPMFAPYERRAR